MKVAELIKDLETGDRTMEHLTKPAVPDNTMTMEAMMQAVQSLGSGGALGGSIGMGLGGLLQSQQSIMQQAQQPQQWSNFGNQQFVSNFDARRSWFGNAGI